MKIYALSLTTAEKLKLPYKKMGSIAFILASDEKHIMTKKRSKEKFDEAFKAAKKNIEIDDYKITQTHLHKKLHMAYVDGDNSVALLTSKKRLRKVLEKVDLEKVYIVPFIVTCPDHSYNRLAIFSKKHWSKDQIEDYLEGKPLNLGKDLYYFDKKENTLEINENALYDYMDIEPKENIRSFVDNLVDVPELE